MKTKLIAFYLPQYHEINENNEWWGNGFTEWTNVKSALPLYPNHYQPRVPFDDNYYNLTEEKVLVDQTNLARKYGINGFCFYHYWFNGKLLLEKPINIYANSAKIDFPFCFSWANETWTNAWKATSNPKILIEQTYGDKNDWEKHFYYLLPFFKNKNYIQYKGKPLFIIYRPELIEPLDAMLELFDDLAKKEGLSGISFAYQHYYYKKEKKVNSKFCFNIQYQPSYAYLELMEEKNKHLSITINIIKKILFKFEKIMHLSIVDNIKPKTLKRISYNDLWENIIRNFPKNENTVPGAFVDWDNTPRRQERGWVADGANPQAFKNYFSELLKLSYKFEKEFLFIFAWNEWAEGGYLEPDNKYKFEYLEAISKTIGIKY